METIDLNLANEDANHELEELNDLSEQMIREEYLMAALHGPRWVLGLEGKAIGQNFNLRSFLRVSMS